MKIGVNLIQYTDCQGLEIFTQNILAHLPLTEEDDVVLFTNQKSAVLFSGLNPRFKIININFSYLNPLSLILFQQFGLTRELKQKKIDILFCPSLAVPLFFRNKIVTIHDVAFRRFLEETSLISRLYLNISLWSVKYFSRAITTVSEFSKNELVSLLKITPSKITVLTEGTPTLTPVSEDKAVQITDRFSLKNKNYFMYIGNVRPRKNLPAVLAAFKIFSQHHSDYHFLIAGKRDSKLIALADAATKMDLADKIIFPGFISPEEKTALLKRSRGLIFISLYEGFGLPVLEAQTLNVPVLSSQTSSLPEIAGNSALLVDPRNIKDIAAGMESIATDDTLRATLIKRGRENSNKYSWRRSAQTLMALCKRYEDPRNK